ncbi:MAG TPA: DUF1638 domain-containing protein [Actinomycetota bacterium]
MTTRSALLDREVAFDAAPSSEAPVLVVACGAIAREVLGIVRLNGWTNVTVRCLPAKLHNRPERIAGEVDRVLAEWNGRAGAAFVAYGDCGTGGALDAVLARRGVGRLPGDHCYAFLAGVGEWLAMHEAEPGTFYLTDFLARHFERFVVRGFRLDEHPELVPVMFGNYRRVVFLAQTDSPALMARAEEAAAFLSLPLEVRRTGLGDLRPALEAFVAGAGADG